MLSIKQVQREALGALNNSLQRCILEEAVDIIHGGPQAFLENMIRSANSISWSGGWTPTSVRLFLELFDILLELGNELDDGCNVIAETFVDNDFQEWFEQVATDELSFGNKKLQKIADRIIRTYFRIE